MFHYVSSGSNVVRHLRHVYWFKFERLGHVHNHASNYFAVDYQLIVYDNIANQIHDRLQVNLY